MEFQIRTALGVLDQDLRLSDADTRLCELLGIESGSAQGCAFEQFLPEGSKADFRQAVTDVLRDGSHETSITLQNGDGSYVFVADMQLRRLTAYTILIQVVDSTRARRIEGSIRSLARETAPLTGQAFFDSVTELLAEATGMRIAFVGRRIANGRIRTISVWDDARGGRVDDFEYELKGSPCETVLANDPCFFCDSVCRRFPEDALLQQMQMESYQGIPVHSVAGELLGIIVLLHDRPMEPIPELDPTLTLLAARAGAEMERMESERALLEQLAADQNYMSTILETTGALIIVVDHDGNIITFNRGCEQTSGYSREEVTGQPFWKYLIPEDERPAVIEALKSLSAGHFPATFENHWLRRDGTKRWISWSNTCTLKPDGSVDLVIGTGIDITEKKEMQHDLLQANEELAEQLGAVDQERNLRKQIMETSGAIVLVVDEEGRLIEFNSAAEQATGYERTEVIGQSATLLVPEKLRTVTLAGLKERLASGSDSSSEYVLLRKDGQKRWVTWQNSVYREPLLGRRLLISIGIDITERKKFEEEQQQLFQQIERTFQEIVRERNFRQQILDTAAAIICVADTDGNVIEFNRVAEEISGYTKDELLGKPYFVLLPPEQRDTARNRLKQMEDGDVEHNIVYPWLTRSGDERHILWSNSAFFDRQGGMEFVIGTGIDITERVEVERVREELFERLQNSLQELQREREFRQSIVETSSALIIVLSETGRIIEFNRGCEEVSGYRRDEVIGRHFSLLIPVDEGHHVMNRFAEMPLKEIEPNVENGWLTKSGDIRWILWNNSSVTDPQTGQQIIIGTGIDITERKKAQKELATAYEDLKLLNDHLEDRVRERTMQLQAANQELEAFSYSVSHDLRAPLRHITGFIDLIHMKAFELDPQLRKYLDIIADSAKRMGMLIDDLLQFSRMGRTEMSQSVIDLNGIVTRVINDLSYETQGRNIEWRITELPRMRCDPSMILLVFQNLIGNALKFTRHRDPAVIEIFSEQAEKGTTIHVRDNGVGFDMQYADKLFGVFQRLHRAEEFEGTGIGLANVRRIVHRHGGTVHVVAALNEGADFSFHLPELRS